MFYFKRNYHSVVQNSSCFIPSPVHNLVSFLFCCFLAILMAYLIMILICISLMTKMLSTFHVHVLVCHPCIFSGEVIQIFHPFFFYGIICCLLNEFWALYIFRIQVLCLIYGLEIFSPSLVSCLFIHLSVFCSVNFDEAQFINYFFYGSWFGGGIYKLCLTQGNKDFLLYPKYFIVLHFTFRPVIDL